VKSQLLREIEQKGDAYVYKAVWDSSFLTNSVLHALKNFGEFFARAMSGKAPEWNYYLAPLSDLTRFL